MGKSRKWYVSTFSLSERRVFRETWISDMNRINSNIEFFKWFEITDKLHKGRQSLSTIVKKWFEGEKTVEIVTQPLKQIEVPVKGKILTVVPVEKDVKDTEGILQIKREFQQLSKPIEPKGRYSFTASSSKSREDEEYSDNSGETMPEPKVQGVDYSSTVPKVYYQPIDRTTGSCYTPYFQSMYVGTYVEIFELHIGLDDLTLFTTPD